MQTWRFQSSRKATEVLPIMAKNKEVIIFICVFVVASIIALYLSYNVKSYSVNSVCFAQKCVSVELAQTSEEHVRGLMFRDSLDEGNGMLFIFPVEGTYNFWMKNTLIPLDVIWINQNFEVVHIESATPCSDDPCQVYTSDEKAKYVLEVNSGFADENGIKVGNNVTIN
jgi:uncharacterized membrane protein (UPF0127 family)